MQKTSSLVKVNEKTKELKESAERFSSLVTNIPGIVYRCANDADWTMLFISHEIDPVSDYPASDFINNAVRSYASIIHPDDRDLVDRAVQKGVKEKAAYSMEYRICRADGHIRWVHEQGQGVFAPNGNLLWLDGVILDITERKRTEVLLRQNEDKLTKSYETLRSLLDSLDSLVYVVDFNSYDILYINKYGRDIWGDIQGRKCWQTIQKDNNGPCSFCTNDKLLSDAGIPTGVYQWEFQNTVTGRWYECRDQAISWAGKALARMEIATDITNRKQAEAEKENLEAQNRQLQKSESLGRMAGAIAHHFNNQLGVVIGNLELAMDNMPQNAEPFDTLNSTMQAAWKAAQISGMMLTYVGQKSGQRDPLDISETCLQSLTILRAVMPGNVVMETDIPSPGPIVSANDNQVQQVLTNLVTNAWESVGDKKGTISLTVKTVTPEEIDAVHRYPRDWQPKDKVYVCLEVTDDGHGIEDKNIEKLFDPFFSTKFTGRGMGLAVVIGIVKAHGGLITVASEQGSGSTFRVFFPVSAEEVPRHSDKPFLPSALEKGGAVLLVEDEEMLRITVATMLKRLGFSVIEAKDGVEAVDTFRQRQNEIRFVLSDLTMPHMDGWESLTALRKLQPDIPVILASGYDKAHVMAGDHPELPQAFLGKPYNLKGLREAINQVLAD